MADTTKRAYEAPRALRMSDGQRAAGMCAQPGSGDSERCYAPGNSTTGSGCSFPGNSALGWACYMPGLSAVSEEGCFNPGNSPTDL
jgi:hypothetical protein